MDSDLNADAKRQRKEKIMNGFFEIDFSKKTIKGTKSVIKKAGKGSGPEYEQLVSLLAKHPDYSVVAKKMKKKAKSKQTYAGLTFALMEKYFEIQPKDKCEQLKKEFENCKKVAADTGVPVYSFTKKWFLASFDEGITVDKIKNEIKRYKLDQVTKNKVA